MKLGILGLPNVGKSTLFNSLTKAGAESANYPFCTIDPNVGVVAVPDERLKLLGDMYQSATKPSDTPAGESENSLFSPSMVQDQTLDFDAPPSPTPQMSHPTPTYNNSVRHTRPEIVREEVRIVDKPVRHVTEIRVYYDDQTWESFVPAKK